MIRTFVWFTYRKDAGILLRSVKSVLSIYPDANIIICDDVSSGSTLPTKAISALKRMGAIMVPTAWPRQGNLRGWACAKEIATTLKWAYEITGADVVVKVDSDVIFLNGKWIEDFLQDENAIVAGTRSRCRRAVCGASYALRKEGLDALCDSYENDMASPYLTEEDFEMSSRLYRYCSGNERMRLLPFSQSGVHPACADAESGIYSWLQDTEQWQAYIATHWQLAVINPDNGLAKGNARSQVAKRLIHLRNTICRG